MSALVHHRASRRTFLRGLGTAAAATAVPFLPSLASDAEAQATSYDKVIFVAWSHGVYPPLWQPTVPGMTSVAPGVRSARMRDATFGLYMADFFAGLEDKITMLKGVGQVGAWGHQTSVALTASERGVDRDYRITSVAPSSIDNVLARSRAVYPVTPTVDVLRLSMAGLDETHSYIDNMWVPAVDANVAFARLFSGGFPGMEPPPPSGPSPAELALRRRALVVRRALDRYGALREGARLSVVDRQRLDDAMQRYRELDAGIQSQLAALQSGAPMPVAQACQSFSVTGADDSEQMMRDHIRLFTQGLACGATRIGYWKLDSSHADVDGAHQAGSSANLRADGLYTRIMRDNCRRVAELLRAMDAVVEGNGRTLLDNSLVVVTSDMATSVIGEHPGVDAPFLLAGGLNGRVRVGEYLDYSDPAHLIADSHGHRFYAGPPHNELLIAIMKALGLPSSDYASGFGQYACLGDMICRDPSPYVAQRKYVDYYHQIHAPQRAPGAELPYLRIA